MSLSARFEAVGEGLDRRGSDRRVLSLKITASLPDSSDQSVLIHDLSETGLLIETRARLTTGQTFKVFLPVARAINATVVWNSDHFYGCQFENPVPRAAVSAALLQSSPKGDNLERVVTHQEVLSQLRKLNARLGRIGQDIDRTIHELSSRTPGTAPKDIEAMLTAALPQTPMPAPPDALIIPKEETYRYSEPDTFDLTSPMRAGLLIAFMLAGLAAVILIAALWP